MASKTKPNRREFVGIATAAFAGLAATVPEISQAQSPVTYLPLTVAAGGTGASYIDLSLPPYNVVANNATASVAQANTAGINAAIAAQLPTLAKPTKLKTKARLVLPLGDIYIDQAAGSVNWSILFGAADSDITLAGQGMFATTLIQQGNGDLGEWDAIRIDGASRIELCDFGIMQGTITNPDPGQQNHLIVVYNNTAGGTTEDIYGHHIYFGKCLGDAIRLLADASPQVVKNIRFTHGFMRLNGIVNGPSGRTGARSGIAIQRGYSNVEFSHFYIIGAQNSGIDMEPTGSNTMDRAWMHNIIVDNSISNTGSAVSLGGVSNGDRATNTRVHDLVVLGGRVNITSTDNMQIERLTVQTSVAVQSDPAISLVSVRQINNDLLLKDLRLERTGTSAAGNCLDIENRGSRTTVEGGLFLQGVPGYPIVTDGCTNLRINGSQIRYEGAAPAGKVGIRVSATLADVANPQIDNVHLLSTTGKLQAAVRFDGRAPRTISNIRVANIHSADFATTGVIFSKGVGSTFDATPEMHGINNGADVVWTQVDQNDNSITSIYPVIAGNRGGICTMLGQTNPEGAVVAMQGSEFIRQNGDSTTWWKKTSNTSNVGWIQLTIN